MEFPGESHGPATCGFARNCPEPEAWTTGLLLLLLYIMLYIVLAYLMLFAALTNAVCLNNASFFFSFLFSLICENAFYFHALSLFISFF